MLALYEKQLGAAGIPLKLEINESLNYPGGIRLIGDHVNNLRRWLDKHGDCQNLVFSDAWDVLFYGTAEVVASKVPSHGVLLAAERNCWPDSYLKESYAGSTPWRYVNGGVLAAKPAQLANWLDEVEDHPAYNPAIMDQQWLNHRLLKHETLAILDADTSLFYCMFLEAGELQFDAGRPYNSITNGSPNFVHFNGKHDSTLFLWKQATSK